MLKLIQAETAEHFDEVRALWREYAEWLGVDLCFQNFEAELNELPGKYAAPDGRLWLAMFEDEVAGGVALRRLDAVACEMKRLYVRPRFRGQRLGKTLIEAIIAEARGIGYAKMRLDTLPSKMHEASTIYRSFGFQEIDAYYFNPVADAVFMELDLRGVGKTQD
jgi:GNAT superfamily N-acetyltransferase